MDIAQMDAKIANSATIVSYATSVGLVVGDMMEFLNDNAGAIGSILGLFTFVLSWVYRHKEFKLKEAEIKKEE